MSSDTNVSRRLTESDEAQPQPDAVLELLADEHAHSILDALCDGPRPAQNLVDVCDASRPTVYRRLDTLEDAGIVTAHTTLHPDGHHRKEFAIAVESLSLELTKGSFTVTDTSPVGE